MPKGKRRTGKTSTHQNLEHGRERKVVTLTMDNVGFHKHLLMSWLVREALLYMKNYDIFTEEHFKLDVNQLMEDIRGYAELCGDKSLILEERDFRQPTQDDGLKSMTKGNALGVHLTFEFMEFVRLYGAQVSLIPRRKVILVQPAVKKLAMLGGCITRAGEGNIFLDLQFHNVTPEEIKIGLDNVRKIINNLYAGGSRSRGKSGEETELQSRSSKYLLGERSMTVGMAAGLALAYHRVLPRSWHDQEQMDLRVIYYRKPYLTSFFLTKLAVDILNLNLAKPLFSLISGYKEVVDRKRERRTKARAFIEYLSDTVIQYHNLGTLDGLYNVIRNLGSDALNEDMMAVYGENWTKIREGLLRINPVRHR